MERSDYIIGSPALDLIFSALADPTRRAILLKLRTGAATVQSIAEPFDISQPAVSRHLKVLENAGLIKRSTNRQTRPAELTAKPMENAMLWLEEFRTNWDAQSDHLDQLLHDLPKKDTK